MIILWIPSASEHLFNLNLRPAEDVVVTLSSASTHCPRPTTITYAMTMITTRILTTIIVITGTATTSVALRLLLSWADEQRRKRRRRLDRETVSLLSHRTCSWYTNPPSSYHAIWTHGGWQAREKHIAYGKSFAPHSTQWASICGPSLEPHRMRAPVTISSQTDLRM